ncbi:MAG: MmgE/PrpD family protein [bacterium]|nr:MmgE/PrpD family protein [bacterium]MDE0668746.1 MmgE/PrpD family protein [bacterium]
MNQRPYHWLMHCGGTPLSVTERLADFVMVHGASPLPDEVRHQARRLLLNAAAASAAGRDHPAIWRLREWALDGIATGGARLLWHGDRTGGDRAALVNGAMLEVLDFNETHIEAFVHPTAPVWPAVQATAELAGVSLDDALTAMALGIEVELAVATMLMPSHYERGFNPAVAAGAVGAAAGCSVILGLDVERTAHALGLAALGGAGPLEVLGTDVHPYRIGDAARSGFTAADLARRGFGAPATAIDGEHGLLATVGERDPERIEGALGSLGDDWRICGPIAFKRYPTETISQAPLDCTLDLRERTPPEKRAQVASMTFAVAPLVAEVNRSRRERFAMPADDQQARFDGSYCTAAAWCRGRFTAEGLGAGTRSDPAVLALRDKVRFVADEGRSMESASIEVTFTDGTTEHAATEAFRGSTANPLSDEDLTAKLTDAAGGIIDTDRINAISTAISVDGTNPAIRDLVNLLVL